MRHCNPTIGRLLKLGAVTNLRRRAAFQLLDAVDVPEVDDLIVPCTPPIRVEGRAGEHRHSGHVVA